MKLGFLLLSSLVMTVRATIQGISWFGLETEYENLMCTWKHDISWNLKKINELGFNSIRLPFSYQYITENNFYVMDHFMKEIQAYNISVCLDFHRLHNTHQSAKPYDDDITFDAFLKAWKILLERYEDVSNIESVDIFNEYQSDNYVEWNNLARQIVQYIESAFPDKYVYFIGGVRWGGDLHFVNLDDLPYSDRIHYTIHKYWFSDEEPYEDKWEYSFGDHSLISVGEFGYISSNIEEVKWAERFVKWLVKNNIHDSFFWTFSGNSIDTGGILLEDCETVDEDKMALLHKLWTTTHWIQ
jgi:endoglucanase